MEALLKKIEHVGIFVSDLDRSIAFYRDVLGLELKDVVDTGSSRIAFMQIGESQLELICHSQAEPRPAGVVDHVTFTVTDIDAMYQRLKEFDVELIDEAPKTVFDSCKILFFFGPDKERLELFQR